MCSPNQLERKCSRSIAASLVALAVLAASAHALAQSDVSILPETVVTASRVAIAAEASGSAITVIEGRELENRQIRLVSDALRDVPGLSVNRAGPPGAITQVRIRGAEGNHTLVIIDGVEANDPAINSEFNFAHLLTDDIERIEVLRGPQSALWGSDAIGGVINVVTKSGRAEGLTSSGRFEAGSFGTIHGNASIRASSQRKNLALSASFLNADGFNISRFGSEKDGFENSTLRAGGLLELSPWLSLKANTQYTHSETQFDPQDSESGSPTDGFVIDGDRLGNATQFYGRGEIQLDTFDGKLEHILGAAYTHTDNDESADGLAAGGSRGEKKKFDYQANYYFDTPNLARAEHTATLYGEIEDERFRNATFTEEATDYAIAGEYRLRLFDRATFSGSVREDFNDGFKDATTFRMTGAYRHPDTATRLHASVGTGVTNPSFFELFGFLPERFNGNPALSPERSTGWDAGVEQVLFDERVVVDATYFQADLDNEIVTRFDSDTDISTVENLAGSSERRGLELSFAARLGERIEAAAAYTWLQSEDAEDLEELRRPRHTASLNVAYRFGGDKGLVNLRADYNGSMRDSEFVPTTAQDRVTLDDFTLVTLSGEYRVSDEVTFLARIENLLDEDYEEQFSYRSAGIAVYGGVRVSFGQSPGKP